MRPLPEAQVQMGQYPKVLEVVKGNKKIGTGARDRYKVMKIEPFENGSKLLLRKMRGQASSATKLVVFVRYAKHLHNDQFNASKGDGINKVVFRVTARGSEEK